MSKLPHYAKIVEPSLDKRNDGKIYYIKSRDGYSALPIDYIDEIENALTKIINLTMDFRDDVKKRIESIADSAGTKFIAIDGKELGLVDEDAFNKLANDIYAAVVLCKNSFNTKLNKWPVIINEINDWLASLEVNYENRKQQENIVAQRQRAYEVAQWNHDHNLPLYGGAVPTAADVAMYESLWKKDEDKLKHGYSEVLDPFEYGSWVPVSYQGYVGPGESYYI